MSFFGALAERCRGHDYEMVTGGTAGASSDLEARGFCNLNYAKLHCRRCNDTAVVEWPIRMRESGLLGLGERSNHFKSVIQFILYADEEKSRGEMVPIREQWWSESAEMVKKA